MAYCDIDVLNKKCEKTALWLHYYLLYIYVYYVSS